ncbi:MAG: type II secretion system protein GspE [bacterium]|nr:type II secretion system protein GspE [bacterium]
MDYKRLGDLLVESGRLTPTQLETALSKKAPGQKLGEALQELGLLTEQQIVETLSQQLGVPAMKSDLFLIDPLIVEIVPEHFARLHTVIPMFLVDTELTIAMADPLDVPALDELRRVTGYRINCILAAPGAIQNALNEYYSVSHSIEDVINSFEDESPELDVDNAPAIRLVNQILFHAIKVSASDIHIEPLEERGRVRFRIDGILHEIFTPPKSLVDVVTARLKILAKLDISEKRLPQDGRFSISVGERDVDVRLSTLPTLFGEKTVLRILDKGSMVVGLDQIGLDAHEKEAVESLLSRSYGLLLITGPTGSGKTTSLYSMIQRLSSPEKNIVTVEDPVEYEFSDINQVQVNAKVSLTFGRALRAILRQDPDIILIGEIRDEETASIAIRSALTGHLVLSTLHTNDAISSIGRMIDMNVAPYLLASALTGVIAQRLVRTVCPHCVQYVTPDAALLERLGVNPAGEVRWAQAKGCNRCNHTGYKGRTAIFEILRIDGALQRLILNSSSSVEVRDAAGKANLSSLRQVGLEKVMRGITTLEEIERVTTALEA